MNPLYAGGCGIDPAPGLVFDEDTWNLRRRIVGDFSNAAPHEAHGNAFISGAWKYLGIPLKPEYENGQHRVTEDPKWNDKIAERRDAVASAYSTPLTMPYSIVTGSDTIETIEATISSGYAVEISKIAVEIIQDATGIFTGESVQTSTDKDSAMWAGRGIKINREQYLSSRVDFRAADSVDGFWMTLHELWHLYTASMSDRLSDAKKKYMTVDGEPVEERHLMAAPSPLVGAGVLFFDPVRDPHDRMQRPHELLEVAWPRRSVVALASEAPQMLRSQPESRAAHNVFKYSRTARRSSSVRWSPNV